MDAKPDPYIGADQTSKSGTGARSLDYFTERREELMSARQKLNSSYFMGSLVIACLIGYLTESTLALLVSFAVFLGMNINNGDIRWNGRRTS